MFKSKIFLKAILIVTSIIVIYTLAISIFAIPKIDESIQNLEEKNAKEILAKVATITKNVYKDLESYKQITLQKHKDELKNLTDVAWSIIQLKYNQSKSENIGILLKKRGDEFKINLMNFYHKNKNKMSKNELKNAIKNYINIHRYNNNTGYFFLNKGTTTVLHPIKPSLNGRNLKRLKDKDGVYFIQKFVSICDKDGSGIVNYKWENPKTKLVEDKISYVFKFEPFNWIIGTGEYYNVLKQKLQNEVIELVNKLRYGDNNYFYISDYNSVLISHPYLQGKDLSKTKDVKGNLIVPPMVKIAREKGEGFYSYWWKKNKKDDTPYEKLTFAKDFPDWKMVIGTGVYIDDIENEVVKRKKELMKQLQQIIKTTKIGKTGYLYIFDINGKMLIHPNDNINGKDFSKLQNPENGTFIFDDLIKASKTSTKALYYKWDKPSDKGNYIYNKVSWVEPIPELNWYIASSAYVDEFKESSNEVRDFIITLAVIIFILTALFSILFFKNLLTPISNLSKLALKVTDGDYSVRCKLERNDEMGILSKSFNKMIDTTEDLIENLDFKVKEKTKELRTLNMEMRDSIEYASFIQSALIPQKQKLEKYFDDSFAIWKPKDIVGGDIYLFEELRNDDECLLMVIDCTGHGVPGAFVTMLVKAIEREIVAKISKSDYDISPAIILQHFNATMKKLLKQESIDALSNAGFDGGIVYINKKDKILRYAGANTPLFYIQDDKLQTIKGDRHSIGYKKSDANYQFNDYTIDINKETYVYLTTDGYVDQTGGEKGLVFGKKRFLHIIRENYKKPFEKQKDIFIDTLMEYQSDSHTRDDTTLIGFKLGN